MQIEDGALRHGLVLVNTGNGKGKTTAMLGTLVRAWGREMHVCVVQFIKAETGNWGEIRAAKKLAIEWHTLGDGFTWRSKDLTESGNKARAAWALAQGKIASGAYDIIALDEVTYTFQYGWLDATRVIEWLRANKPPELHLILTGRDAPPELVEYADLVTEMREIKHPYQKGILAQAGVEF
ncbi:MAG: cob(I)yrinic acid a,c-diamide adenosyltransferase [Chloroflexi bacterium]|nr:cob(I)yrinic acid a,c-diamide adenosyltransferase [Chloroflexota bacterium]